jgi:ACS family glucarate transporter-like MFS transporter
MHRRFYVALALFGILFVNYMDRAALAVAAKPIQTEFGLSPVAMGYLFSSFLWSYIICLIPIGMFVDRIGTKNLIGGGLVLWSVATAAVAGVAGFGSFLVARLFMGAGEATTYPGAAKVIRDWAPERERGQFHTIFSSGTGAGTAFGNLVIAWLVTMFEWRMAFVIIGVIGIVLAWPWMRLFGAPEKVSWLKPEERDKILAERSGATAAAYTSGGLPPSGMFYLLSKPTVIGLMVTQGCNVYITYMFATWLPTYMQQTFQLTLASSGALSAIPYVGMVILSIIIARFSDRTLSPQMIAKGMRRNAVALTMLVGVLIAATPLITSLPVILAIFTIVITMLNVGNAFTQALANDLLDNPRDAGRLMGLVIFGGNVCGLTAPIITGYIVAGTGAFQWAFWVAGILAGVGAMTVISLCRHRIGAQHATLPQSSSYA